MTSGGNNFNDFSENQLNKCRAVQTIFSCQKFCGPHSRPQKLGGPGSLNRLNPRFSRHWQRDGQTQLRRPRPPLYSGRAVINGVMYTDECTVDSDCGSHGECKKVTDFSYPQRQCFCQPGWFGDKCEQGTIHPFIHSFLIFTYDYTISPSDMLEAWAQQLGGSRGSGPPQIWTDPQLFT